MATPILMPKQGNTVEECVLLSWKVSAGDAVEKGQALGEIETDKATFELEAPEAGCILALLCKAGEAVPVLQTIAVIGKKGEDYSSLTSAAGGTREKTPAPDAVNVNTTGPAAPASTSAAMPTTKSGESVGVSPRAKNLAQAKGVALDTCSGSGPGGRVIARDVEAASRMTPLARDLAAGHDIPSSGSGLGGRVRSPDLIKSPGTTTAATAAAAAETATVPPGDFEELKLSGIRKLIAERMYASLQNSAQLTLNTSAPATILLEYRRRLKAAPEQKGLPRLSINDMLLFVVSRVLKRHPDLNATLQGGIFRKHKSVHLGFACNTPRGLMVPVVRGAEKLSAADLADAVTDLAGKARDGKISPNDLQGGTFTVSNLGALGVTSFTPILNTPQVAILGVGAIELKPVRREDKVIFEDHLNLSLTIDHQVIDGWQASLFLQELVGALTHFELWLTR